MTGHIYLTAVPATDDELRQMLKPQYMRYGQRFKQVRSWKEDIWQRRIFPSLDGFFAHLQQQV